jgi:hypothetical protein
MKNLQIYRISIISMIYRLPLCFVKNSSMKKGQSAISKYASGFNTRLVNWIHELRQQNPLSSRFSLRPSLDLKDKLEEEMLLKNLIPSEPHSLRRLSTFDSLTVTMISTIVIILLMILRLTRESNLWLLNGWWLLVDENFKFSD